MGTLNFLNKKGILSDDDKRQPFTHAGEYFIFDTCLDLSEGVKVTPLGSRVEYSSQEYSNDLSDFICFWTNFIYKDLNGFSGFGRINFELNNFTIKD